MNPASNRVDRQRLLIIWNNGFFDFIAVPFFGVKNDAAGLRHQVVLSRRHSLQRVFQFDEIDGQLLTIGMPHSDKT